MKINMDISIIIKELETISPREAAEKFGLECKEDAVVLPGWVADDGNASVYYPEATTRREAAKQYVEDGEWGEVSSTEWLDIMTCRLALDADGENVHLDHLELTVAIHPEEPDCKNKAHSWKEEQFGSYGIGTFYNNRCSKCGITSRLLTRTQRPDNGEYVGASIEYFDNNGDPITTRITTEAP